MLEVGKRIREIREEYGMSQAELARRVGVAGNHLYQVEAGSRRPSLGLIERIARELRTEPAEFLREPAPLAQAPQGQSEAEAPDQGQPEITPEAVPGISGHAHLVGIHEGEKGTEVTQNKKSFFEVVRELKRQGVIPTEFPEEEAWQRFQEEEAG